MVRRHRYTGTLSFYRCWTPEPVPLTRLIAIAVIRWRIEEDHQLAKQTSGLDAGQAIRWRSWHRWSALCLLAYPCPAVAVALQHPPRHPARPGPRADPGHHPEHGARTHQGVAVRVAQRVLTMTAAIWHNHRTGQTVTRSLIAYDH